MIVNEEYKFEADSLNITLFQKRINKKNGNSRWESIAFFADPRNALDFLIKSEIMGTGMKDLETVVKKIHQLEDMIKKLKGLPEIRRRPVETGTKSRRIPVTQFV